jgi:hypothetical protein
MPASCAWKGGITWSRTATWCISASTSRHSSFGRHRPERLSFAEDFPPLRARRPHAA